MPEDERILRMNYLRRREKLNDVNYWTKSFLSAMGSLQTQEDHDEVGSILMPAVTLDDFDEYLAKYEQPYSYLECSYSMIFLGTLVTL